VLFDTSVSERSRVEEEEKKKEKGKERMVALRPHTPKHVRGGWSHYTDTSKPDGGYGAQNMVTVQSRSRTSDLSITGPAR
jgi:hypothetical protein